MFRILILASLLMGGVAQAELKPDGYVKKFRCSDASEQKPRIGGPVFTRVCTAKVQGDEQNNDYLYVDEIRRVKSKLEYSNRIWLIRDKSVSVTAQNGYAETWNLLRVGREEGGLLVYEKTTVAVTGEVEAGFSNQAPDDVQFIKGELQGREIEALDFQGMMTTL